MAPMWATAQPVPRKKTCGEHARCTGTARVERLHAECDRIVSLERATCREAVRGALVDVLRAAEAHVGPRLERRAPVARRGAAHRRRRQPAPAPEHVRRARARSRSRAE